MNELTIVILAGGRATRLPGKLTLHIDDEPMILRVYRNMRATSYPCVLSLKEPLSDELQTKIDAPAIYDTYDEAGPLGGLASAAAEIVTPLMFAVAADLPNLGREALDALLQLSQMEAQRKGQPPAAVVPRHSDGNIEPLAALYGTKALAAAARHTLSRGRKKVSEAIAVLNPLYYDIPPERERMYLNINTAADFEQIKAV